METVDEQYKEGFNIGYWLARGNDQIEKDVLNDLIRRRTQKLPSQKG